MKFEKKLVILSGENNAKGTVTLENNAYGTFATLNVYNFPDIVWGEYAVGIKNADQVFTRKLGSMGRILSRFKIGDMSLCGIHTVIYCTATETPVLYGHTPDAQKLWAGNMMDGIRSRKVEFPKTIDKAEIEKSLPQYSDRPQEIENYFLDILPQDGDYRDSAVAQVNYYPTDMSIEVSYTNREQSGFVPEENPIDEHVRKSVESELAGSGGNGADEIAANAASNEKTLPWQYAKQYIERYKNYPTLGGSKPSGGDISVADKSINDAATVLSKKSANDEQSIEDSIKDTAGDSAKVGESDDPYKSIEDSAAATVVPPASEYTAENALRDSKTEAVFYEQIKTQLDELFGSNPKFDVLSSMMPETKWIKVDYDGSGKYYVVGVIGEKPDYICYGVPASYTPEPPAELDGYCQWLPLDAEKPEGDGFWIMYQDAITGKSVKK